MILTVPNLLSILRMGLVPLFLIAVLDDEPVRALLIVLVGGITDALDGFIARFYHQQSLLGTYLDPMADKLMLTAAYVVLAIPSHSAGFTIPLWISVLVIGRDVLIVIIALILLLAAGVKRFPPHWLGKVTTAAQVVTALVVLITRIRPQFSDVAEVAVYIVAALTVASGLNYVVRAARLEKAEKA